MHLAHPRRDGAMHLLLDPWGHRETVRAVSPHGFSCSGFAACWPPGAQLRPEVGPRPSRARALRWPGSPAGGPRRPGATRRLATLMRRVFAIDALLCSRLCRPPPGDRLHRWAEAARLLDRGDASHTRPSRRNRLDNPVWFLRSQVCGQPGRLTSRLRQRSIAAQAGRGGNEVKVGARPARECPRNARRNPTLDLRGAEGGPRAHHNSEGGLRPPLEDLTGGVGNG